MIALRSLAAVCVLSVAAALASACTSTVPPGGPGASCADDKQCDVKQSLVCRCIVTKAGDDDGADAVLKNGFCAVPTTPCPTDGGVNDASGDAGASDGAVTSSSDAGSTGSTSDAASGG
jgi:hypothetical protein